MGDEATPQEGDGVFETTVEGAPEAPPAASETPAASPSGDETQPLATGPAQGLTGDENEEQIQAHFKTVFDELKLPDKRREQFLGWRTAKQTGEGRISELEAELAGLREAKGEEVDLPKLAREVALSLDASSGANGGWQEKLAKDGPAKFLLFAAGGGTPPTKPEQPTFDADDPRDRMLQDMQKRLEGIETAGAEATKAETQRVANEKFAGELQGAVEALKLQSEPGKQIVARVAVDMWADAIDNGADRKTLPIAQFVPKAKQLLDEFGPGKIAAPSTSKPGPTVPTEPASDDEDDEPEVRDGDDVFMDAAKAALRKAT